MKNYFRKILDELRESSQNVYLEKHNYSFFPETVIFFFLLFCIVIFYLTTDVNFFGNKTNSFFDYWSLMHIFSGGTLSYLAFKLRNFKITNPILFILCISLSWEILESYIELGMIFKDMTLWFGGQESFFNRLLGDQISIISGFILIKLFPKIYYIFLFFSVSFLVFHIIVGTSIFLI